MPQAKIPQNTSNLSELINFREGVPDGRFRRGVRYPSGS